MTEDGPSVNLSDELERIEAAVRRRNASRTLTADMVERAAAVLREEADEAGVLHTDLHDLARAALSAAFEAPDA